MREEFYKQKYEVKKQQEEIKKLEFMHKKKNRLVEVEKRKADEEEKKKAAMENRPHPYLKEIEICEDLIDYCQRLSGVKSEESKTESKTFHNEMREREIKDTIAKKFQDKVLEAVDRGAIEASKQDDIFSGLGGGKNKKQRKRKG